MPQRPVHHSEQCGSSSQCAYWHTCHATGPCLRHSIGHLNLLVILYVASAFASLLVVILCWSGAQSIGVGVQVVPSLVRRIRAERLGFCNDGLNVRLIQFLSAGDVREPLDLTWYRPPLKGLFSAVTVTE